MSQFFAVVFFSIFAGALLVSAQDDGISLLQGAIETKKAAFSADLEEDADDYGTSESFKCTHESGGAKIPITVAPLSNTDTAAGTLESSQKVQPSVITSDNVVDPPGAGVLRGVLCLLIVLLICDGTHRWMHESRLSETSKTRSCSCPALEETNEAAEEEAESLWLEVVVAAQNGDSQQFQTAMQKRPSLQKADAWGCTALHFAAAGGSQSIVSHLLKSRLDLNALDDMEESALHFAARAGGAAICEMLLDAGANMDLTNANGLTPLVVAGHSHSESVCRLLAQRGAGCGGIPDSELPPLVVSQMVKRMFAAPL